MQASRLCCVRSLMHGRLWRRTPSPRSSLTWASSRTETTSSWQVCVQCSLVAGERTRQLLKPWFSLSPRSMAVADIPGLIPGAHLNRGLGVSFLRHIERCRLLLFVLDMSSAEPWEQLQQLCFELDQYNPQLSHRPRAIVANKMDLPEARRNLEALRSRVHQTVIPVSALTGHNTAQLILHLREMYDSYPQNS